MVSLAYDMAQEFFNLGIVPVEWNDVINSMTSSNSDRIGFKYVFDFYVEGAFAGTTKNYPFQDFGYCQLNSFTKNLLTYDRNWRASPSKPNPNSFKKCQVRYGEEFSRKLQFESISATMYGAPCATASVIQLNYTVPTDLVVGDRVFIVKDDSSINKQYNTYATVLDVGSNYLVLNIEYVTPTTPGFVETGIIYEGSEMIGYDPLTGIITTTNPHKFLLDDQIIIQVDNRSHGTLNFSVFNSYTVGDEVTSVQVGGDRIDMYVQFGFGGNPNEIRITPSTMLTSDLPITTGDIINIYAIPGGGYFSVNTSDYITVPGTIILDVIETSATSDSYGGGIVNFTNPFPAVPANGLPAGLKIMTTPATYSTSIDQLNNDIVSNINCNESITDWRAFYSGSGGLFHIYSPIGQAFSTSGLHTFLQLNNTTNNLAYFNLDGQMASDGFDSNGSGVNFGMSDTYVVAGVPSSTEIKLDRFVTPYYANQFGSELGTIYSMNNYVIRDQIIGTTFSLQLADYNFKSFYQEDAWDQEYRQYTLKAPQTISGTSGFGNIETDVFGVGDIYTLDVPNYYLLGNPTQSQIDMFRIYLFSGGVQVASYTQSGVYYPDEKITLGIGPHNINLAYSLNPGDFYPAPSTYGSTLPIDFSLCDEYRVIVRATPLISNIAKFYKKCTTDRIGFTWLNDFGAWEYYYMDSSNIRQQVDILRSTMTKVGNYKGNVEAGPGGANPNGMITYDSERRGITTYNSMAAITFKLTTPILKPNVADFLITIMNSEEVYLILPEDQSDPEFNNTTIVPITMLDESMPIVTDKQKIKYYTFNFKIATYKFNKSING